MISQKKSIESREVMTIFLNWNVFDTIEDPTSMQNEPDVVLIERPPPDNSRRRSGRPLNVGQHVDTAVYGLQAPRNLKNEYMSARSQGVVFRCINNRIIDPAVETTLGKWIGEFDKHKCYAKKEILFRTILKGNKGRAKDRLGCVQEALYCIQVTHKKLFTPEILAIAQKFAIKIQFHQRK